jgi:hypothetical protein
MQTRGPCTVCFDPGTLSGDHPQTVTRLKNLAPGAQTLKPHGKALRVRRYATVREACCSHISAPRASAEGSTGRIFPTPATRFAS